MNTNLKKNSEEELTGENGSSGEASMPIKIPKGFDFNRESEKSELEVPDAKCADLQVLPASRLPAKQSARLIEGDELMEPLNLLHPVVWDFMEEQLAKGRNKDAEPTDFIKSDATEYACLVINEILLTYRKSNRDLLHVKSEYLWFNGKYYKKFSIELLRKMLFLAAIRCGIEEIYAESVLFLDLLQKQFESSAMAEFPERKPNTTLINLQNGTYVVDGSNHFFRKHDKNDFLTYILPFDYNPAATAPEFMSFIEQVLPEEESRKIICEYTGYIFYRELRLQRMLICYGTGRNGKSLYFRIIKELLGKDNTTSFSLQQLCGKDSNARFGIENKLLNYTDEMGNNFDAAIFKILTSNEPVPAKKLYRDITNIDNYARLATSTNLFPSNIEATYGNFERYLFIYFGVTIPRDKIDSFLGDRIIQNELSGVFNWVLTGLDRLISQKRFSESENSQRLHTEFRKEADYVLSFLEEKGYVKSENNKMLLKELYKQYVTFCESYGYKNHKDARYLSRRLHDLGFEKTTISKNYTAYLIGTEQTTEYEIEDLFGLPTR